MGIRSQWIVTAKRSANQSEEEQLMSKVSIERISKIVRLIRKRGYISMGVLKDELEVSEASIKRDFDFLKD
jgi:DeoR/GlpR family transcriptional regulator of sugar metabolism